MAVQDEIPQAPTDQQLKNELAAIPYEPLLPVEVKLIAGSLILGAILLGVLVWISYTFFPAPQP